MKSRVSFSQHAILTARKDNVAEINTAVFNIVIGETCEFLSADKVDEEENSNVIPTELLDRIDVSGWPPHRLQISVCSPIMLL